MNNTSVYIIIVAVFTFIVAIVYFSIDRIKPALSATISASTQSGGQTTDIRSGADTTATIASVEGRTTPVEHKTSASNKEDKKPKLSTEVRAADKKPDAGKKPIKTTEEAATYPNTRKEEAQGRTTEQVRTEEGTPQVATEPEKDAALLERYKLEDQLAELVDAETPIEQRDKKIPNLVKLFSDDAVITELHEDGRTESHNATEFIDMLSTIEGASGVMVERSDVDSASGKIQSLHVRVLYE